MQTDNQHYWLLSIPLIGLAAMLLPIELREQLYLHIDLTKQGEYWRFVSAHFVYVSWLHWLLNSIGVFVFFLFLRDIQRPINYRFAIVFILIIISAGLLTMSSHLIWYVGFSGTLAGLFAATAINTFNQKPALSVGIILLLMIYVFIQLQAGELVAGALMSIRSSSYAHALGLFAGITYSLSYLLLRYIREK